MRLGKYMMLSDKLTGEYKAAFDEVESYGDYHLVGGSYKNEKIMDLLDVLLTAQEDLARVSKIIGKDTNKFAKDYFSDITLTDMAEPVWRKISL